MKRVQAIMKLPAQMERKRDQQDGGKAEQTYHMGGGVLVEVDHIHDVTMMAMQVRGLLLRRGWLADGASRLGIHMTGKVRVTCSAKQDVFMRDDQAARRVGKKWDDKLPDHNHHHGAGQ
jgi:hypothetical protein